MSPKANISNTATLQLNISYRQIIKIAVPISFAILIPQLNFFINTLFLGSLGTHELGDAGITGVYYLVFSSIGYGLNNGLQSLVARSAGANDASSIGKLFTQGVFIALGIAALAITITYTLLPWALQQFWGSAAATTPIINYLQIRIWGLPFLYMFQMRNALLVGINKSKYLPIGTAAETIVNVLLDWGLIFGTMGLPKLGFNGAAYASIIADVTGMLVTYGIVKWKGIDKTFGLFQSYKVDSVYIKKILQQSGPLIFQHAISILSWLLFFLYVGKMANAETNLAVSNTMRNIFGLFGVVTWAMGSTTNTMVSNVVGQGKQHLIPLLLKRLVTITISFAGFFCIILNIFPAFIFEIFSNDDAVVQAAIPVMRVVSLALILMSVSVVCLNVVIGSGYAKVSFGIEVFTIIAYVSYTYITMQWLKVPLSIAWMNEWLYWIGLGGLSFWYINAKLLHQKTLVEK